VREELRGDAGEESKAMIRYALERGSPRKKNTRKKENSGGGTPGDLLERARGRLSRRREKAGNQRWKKGNEKIMKDDVGRAVITLVNADSEKRKKQKGFIQRKD